MTASMFDRGWIALALMIGGCASRLPPEPAGKDASDARARATKYEAPANPYETSAFEGVNVDSAGGHEHMHHGAKPAAEPAKPEPAPAHEHGATTEASR